MPKVSLARGFLGEITDQRQRLAKLRHCFGDRAVADRLARRLEPEADGALGKSGQRQMMRQQCRLSLHDVLEPPLVRFGDTRVQRLTPGAQQRAVSGILHQGMLEQIGRMRGYAPSE